MSAGVQVERPRQGEHHSHDADVCVYGDAQGTGGDGWFGTAFSVKMTKHPHGFDHRCWWRWPRNVLPSFLVAWIIRRQAQYKTVAKAVQAAAVSLLEDKDMKYQHSFYYWAAFISHGFASVKLDDALLNDIHTRLETLKDIPNGAGHDSPSDPLETAMLTLTRNAYRRLEEQEKILSREWCEKWGVR